MTSDLSVFGSCPLDLQKQIKDHLDAHPDSLDLLVKLLNQPPPKIIERKLPKPSTPVIAQMSVTMQLPLRKKVNVEFYQDLVHFEADQTVQYQYQDLQHLLVFNTPNKMGHYTCVGITDKPEFIFGFEKLDVKTRLKLDTHPKKAMELLVQKIIKRPLSFIPRDGIQVECHQRTKDGVLVITKELIFFGLKKPLFYWKTSEVDHVHINSITQRTFNLTVEKKDEMVEFSLIDASEYDKMRKYIEELVNIGEEGPKPVPEEDEEEDHDFQGESESDIQEEFDSETGSVSINSDSEVSEDDEEGDLDIVEDPEPLVPQKRGNPFLQHLSQDDEVDELNE